MQNIFLDCTDILFLNTTYHDKHFIVSYLPNSVGVKRVNQKCYGVDNCKKNKKCNCAVK